MERESFNGRQYIKEGLGKFVRSKYCALVIGAGLISSIKDSAELNEFVKDGNYSNAARETFYLGTELTATVGLTVQKIKGIKNEIKDYSQQEAQSSEPPNAQTFGRF